MNSVFFLSAIVGIVLGAIGLWFVVQRVLQLPRFNVGRNRAQVVATAFSVLVVSLASVSIWWNTSGHNKFAPPAGETSEGVGGNPQVAHSGDLNALLIRLEDRMKREPNDAEGWALLARTHMELKHYREAASGYAKAIAMLPNETSLYIEFVDAEVMANNKEWTKAATSALAIALKLEPTQPKALWLAGTERFDQKDYAGAVKHWELLAKNTAPDSDYSREIAPALIEARALRDGRDPSAAIASANISVSATTTSAASAGSGMGGLSMASTNANNIIASAQSGTGNLRDIDSVTLVLREKLASFDVAASSASNSTAPIAASTSKRVSGEIKLAPSMAAGVAPDDIVFVFARSDDPSAPRLPLAVAKYRASELPIRFDLSDNNSMSAEAKISSANRVIVTARISKTGEATAKPGDFEGVTKPLAVGTSAIVIVINRKL